MFSNKMAALVAASLVVATTPAVAAPASALSLESARAGAPINSESELAGSGFWVAIIGVALIAAFVLVVIEDDNVDLPESP